MQYVVCDLETTGGKKEEEGITEIALYKITEDEILDSYTTLVNPEKPIPPFVQNLTGITDEMVKDAPKFHEVMFDILDFVEGCVFVAHNVKFDYSFLQYKLLEYGEKWKAQQLCTIQMARKTFPNQPSYSLGKLCANLGIELEGRHRAWGDALATVKLFQMVKASRRVS